MRRAIGAQKYQVPLFHPCSSSGNRGTASPRVPHQRYPGHGRGLVRDVPCARSTYLGVPGHSGVSGVLCKDVHPCTAVLRACTPGPAAKARCTRGPAGRSPPGASPGRSEERGESFRTPGSSLLRLPQGGCLPGKGSAVGTPGGAHPALPAYILLVREKNPKT